MSQPFVCRLARLAVAIGSRVIGWGRLTPPPPVSGEWRNIPETVRLASKIVIHASALRTLTTKMVQMIIRPNLTCSVVNTDFMT